MNVVVAQTELDVLWPDGRRAAVVVAIGQPYREPNTDAWRCPLSLQGLSPEHSDVAGNDALQALLLALRLAHYELAGAAASGARLLHPGADPNDPDEIFDLGQYFANWSQSPT
jgi:hypothetical protein